MKQRLKIEAPLLEGQRVRVKDGEHNWEKYATCTGTVRLVFETNDCLYMSIVIDQKMEKHLDGKWEDLSGDFLNVPVYKWPEVLEVVR